MSVEGPWGAPDSVAPPTRIGRFSLLRKLGAGGMGEVWLAQAHSPERLGGGVLGELVAVKRMLSHLTYDGRTAEMFLDEARIASKLDHPTIVRILEVGKDRDIHYFAMEFVEGETLARVLDRLRRRRLVLPPVLAAQIGADVLAGLHHAHTRADARGRPLHIVHRDVTPPNVMITDQGLVKVLDFGIAKAVDRAARTEAGAFKGKVEYLAPEQIQGTEPDPRTDLFALGAVLWEALTGRKLFVRETMVATLAAISEARVLPPSRLSPDVPAELDTIVLRALERRPEDRFASAEAMERALRGFLAAQDPLELAQLMADLFPEEQAARAAERQLARASAARRSAAPPGQPPSASVSGETDLGSRRPGSAVEEPTQVGLQTLRSERGYAEPELPEAVAANLLSASPIDTGSAVMTYPGPSASSPPPRAPTPPARASSTLGPTFGGSAARGAARSTGAGARAPAAPSASSDDARGWRRPSDPAAASRLIAGQETAMLMPGESWGLSRDFPAVDGLASPALDPFPAPPQGGTDADVAPAWPESSFPEQAAAHDGARDDSAPRLAGFDPDEAPLDGATMDGFDAAAGLDALLSAALSADEGAHDPRGLARGDGRGDVRAWDEPSNEAVLLREAPVKLFPQGDRPTDESGAYPRANETRSMMAVDALLGQLVAGEEDEPEPDAGNATALLPAPVEARAARTSVPPTLLRGSVPPLDLDVDEVPARENKGRRVLAIVGIIGAVAVIVLVALIARELGRSELGPGATASANMPAATPARAEAAAPTPATRGGTVAAATTRTSTGAAPNDAPTPTPTPAAAAELAVAAPSPSATATGDTRVALAPHETAPPREASPTARPATREARPAPTATPSASPTRAEATPRASPRDTARAPTAAPNAARTTARATTTRAPTTARATTRRGREARDTTRGTSSRAPTARAPGVDPRARSFTVPGEDPDVIIELGDR